MIFRRFVVAAFRSTTTLTVAAFGLGENGFGPIGHANLSAGRALGRDQDDTLQERRRGWGRCS